MQLHCIALQLVMWITHFLLDLAEHQNVLVHCIPGPLSRPLADSISITMLTLTIGDWSRNYSHVNNVRRVNNVLGTVGRGGMEGGREGGRGWGWAGINTIHGYEPVNAVFYFARVCEILHGYLFSPAFMDFRPFRSTYIIITCRE